MAIGTTAALIGGAALGGIAGAIPKNSSSNSSVNLSDASGMENLLAGTGAVDNSARIRELENDQKVQAASTSGNILGRPSVDHSAEIARLKAAQTSGSTGFLQNNYNEINNMVQAGPGQQDVVNSTGASRSLADMYKQYSQTGGLPSQQDIDSSNGIALNLFNPQRVAQQQSFEDQTTAANRQAALLGRSINDPILQAKLRTQQMRDSSLLEANQGSFAQQFALAQPDRRLGYANQHANILGGLATQAMSNRQSLAAMGEGILQREREFRLQTANRTSSGSSGGGVGGFMTGALAGAGAGMQLGAGMNNLGGSGGGGFNFSGAGSGAPSLGKYGQGPSNNFFGLGK